MTAVRELVELLDLELFDSKEKAMIEISKINELFEQQIKCAYNQGFRDGAADAASYPNISDFNDVAVYENAQNYYNKTFKK